MCQTSGEVVFILLILGVCVCGALSHTCAKTALGNGMSNYRFYLVRILAGALASGILYLVILDPEQTHFFQCFRTFLPTIWLGALVPFGSNVFYFEALRRGDLCVVAPAGHTAPIFVALLAWPLLNEIPTLTLWISLAFILAGLVLSARGRHATHPHLGAWVILPVILAIGTALCNSLNYVFQRKLLLGVPKADINFLQNVVSLLLFSIYYLWSTRRTQAAPRNESRPRRNVLLTVASGILVFSMSNLFMLLAIERAPKVSLAMALVTLAVPVSALFGWVLLRERPTRVQLAGGALIFAGAMLAKLVA